MGIAIFHEQCTGKQSLKPHAVFCEGTMAVTRWHRMQVPHTSKAEVVANTFKERRKKPQGHESWRYTFWMVHGPLPSTLVPCIISSRLMATKGERK